jgi:hypothetical protein
MKTVLDRAAALARVRSFPRLTLSLWSEDLFNQIMVQHKALLALFATN